MQLSQPHRKRQAFAASRMRQKAAIPAHHAALKRMVEAAKQQAEDLHILSMAEGYAEQFGVSEWYAHNL